MESILNPGLKWLMKWPKWQCLEQYQAHKRNCFYALWGRLPELPWLVWTCGRWGQQRATGAEERKGERPWIVGSRRRVPRAGISEQARSSNRKYRRWSKKAHRGKRIVRVMRSRCQEFMRELAWQSQPCQLGSLGMPRREANNQALRRRLPSVASSHYTMGNRVSLTSTQAAHINKTILLGKGFFFLIYNSHS